MAVVTVKIRNKDRLLRALKAKVPKLQAAIEVANLQSAQEIAEMAQRLVPVDEGDLRDSIVATAAGQISPGGVEVPAGGARVSTADYKAAWVEFGTVKSRAQPFFFPSYRANRKRARSRVGRAIGKALKG